MQQSIYCGYQSQFLLHRAVLSQTSEYLIDAMRMHIQLQLKVLADLCVICTHF
jgi:hypothetical protein